MLQLWKNLENHRLMKKKVTKTAYYMIPFIQNILTREIYTNRIKISVCSVLERMGI